MPRIKIDLPERFDYVTEAPIEMSHVNQARHLDSVALLALFANARAHYWASIDYENARQGDVRVIVADTSVAYRTEAFYGDTIVFGIAPTDFNKYGCDIVFRASSKLYGQEIARGKCGVVFFDYLRKVPVRMPSVLLERMRTAPAVSPIDLYREELSR